MRTKKGIVSSAKMAKTIVVKVHTYKSHPKYHKRFRITKKFYAHDEGRRAKEGDQVVIVESRPLSRLKRWNLIEVNGQKIENKTKIHQAHAIPHEANEAHEALS